MMVIYFLLFVRQGVLAYLRTFPFNKKAILPFSHLFSYCAQHVVEVFSLDYQGGKIR